MRLQALLVDEQIVMLCVPAFQCGEEVMSLNVVFRYLLAAEPDESCSGLDHPESLRWHNFGMIQYLHGLDALNDLGR